MTEVTAGTLLNGRVRYSQPVDGYRTGIEPVLLAASIPVRAGERVLEAGTGAGAGLLCLLARVPGVLATGIELDPSMADLARRNAAANGATPEILTADVGDAALHGPFDHAFANPPWHDPAGTTPAAGLRRLAKHEAGAGLHGWVEPLARSLALRGTLSLILPASKLAEACSTLCATGFRAIAVAPFWPRAGVPAKLVLLQARRRGTGRLGAGLVLHEADGRYTAAADLILRDGASLSF